MKNALTNRMIATEEGHHLVIYLFPCLWTLQIDTFIPIDLPYASSFQYFPLSFHAIWLVHLVVIHHHPSFMLADY